MRSCVLVVAQQVGLRAKIARVLHSAGYAVELAGSQERALGLATRAEFQAAIIVPSADLAGLEGELRDTIPKTIVLGDRLHASSLNHRAGDGDSFFEEALNEQILLDELSRPTAP